MLKIVSFIFVLATVIWTWTLFNSKSSLTTQIHAEIQSKLAVLIEDTIKNKKPNSANFELKQIYTHAINEDLISAQFSYQYDEKIITDGEENTTVQTMSGTANLVKTPTENSTLQKWVIQSVQTNQESVQFNDPLIINAGSTEK